MGVNETTSAEQSKAVMLVAVGAMMFGFLGLFTRFLHIDKGLPSFDVAMLRLVTAALTLLIIELIFSRSNVSIKLKDLPFFALFGLFKFLSDGCYFYAQGELHLSLATLLQMTSPYFVMIISYFLFREKITSLRIIAVIIAITGCVMVTGVFMEKTTLNLGGMISGLLAGLFFGLFSIGGKLGHDKGYSPATILLYTLLFASLFSVMFSLFTSDIAHAFSMCLQFDSLGAILVLGILLTLVPFYLYTYACSKVPASLVSLVAVLELVVSTIVGWVFFNEVLSIINIGGMVLVVVAIIVSDRLILDKLLRKVRKDQAS